MSDADSQPGSRVFDRTAPTEEAEGWAPMSEDACARAHGPSWTPAGTRPSRRREGHRRSAACYAVRQKEAGDSDCRVPPQAGSQARRGKKKQLRRWRATAATTTRRCRRRRCPRRRRYGMHVVGRSPSESCVSEVEVAVVRHKTMARTPGAEASDAAPGAKASDAAPWPALEIVLSARKRRRGVEGVFPNSTQMWLAALCGRARREARWAGNCRSRQSRQGQGQDRQSGQ